MSISLSRIFVTQGLSPFCTHLCSLSTQYKSGQKQILKYLLNYLILLNMAIFYWDDLSNYLLYEYSTHFIDLWAALHVLSPILTLLFRQLNVIQAWLVMSLLSETQWLVQRQLLGCSSANLNFSLCLIYKSKNEASFSIWVSKVEECEFVTTGGSHLHIEKISLQEQI